MNTVKNFTTKSQKSREIAWSSRWLFPYLCKKMEKDDIPGLYYIYTNIS